ncbi:MAG: NAD(P)/FAD-dependent oxidoreductase [Clostridia bacterium]|nr:NAD(P)/FAD-dependent oxidoreductase [Clostridia bacterium]
MRVAVVGAGASGLFVSGLLAKSGADVTVFEKNDKVGKKLFITGKGRCNFTNVCSVEEFLQNVVRGEKFLKSALYGFSSYDTLNYFSELGLEYKVERGNRAFPKSDKSGDVIKVLKEKHCKNVKFLFSDAVSSVYKDKDQFVVISQSGKWTFDKVIVATGGVSYSATGSTGDGYKIARSFGHEIVKPVSALCPIKLKDKFVKKLQGVSLKNVSLCVKTENKTFSEFGEMLFTDCGISGPIVLTASCFVNRSENVSLSIDFKPALTEKQVDLRLLRDFDENKNKDLKTVMKGLLPKAVADVFPAHIGIDENKKIHDITKEEREKIVSGLKDFKLHFDGLYDINSGIVTSGGVDLKQINPKTMESKVVSNLYFLGEVLDVDALTGGFNLQIAWSTAFACAKAISSEV